MHGHACHQQGLQNQSVDKAWCWASKSELQPALVYNTDVEIETETQPSEAELCGWRHWGLLPPGKGGRSLTVRKPVDLKMANVYHDTANLEKALRLEAKQ